MKFKLLLIASLIIFNNNKVFGIRADNFFNYNANLAAVAVTTLPFSDYQVAKGIQIVTGTIASCYNLGLLISEIKNNPKHMLKEPLDVIFTGYATFLGLYFINKGTDNNLLIECKENAKKIKDKLKKLKFYAQS